MSAECFIFLNIYFCLCFGLHQKSPFLILFHSTWLVVTFCTARQRRSNNKRIQKQKQRQMNTVYIRLKGKECSPRQWYKFRYGIAVGQIWIYFQYIKHMIWIHTICTWKVTQVLINIGRIQPHQHSFRWRFISEYWLKIYGVGLVYTLKYSLIVHKLMIIYFLRPIINWAFCEQ